MKVETPQIVWHGREPVLSIDVHESVSHSYRIATGGADKIVNIWSWTLSKVEHQVHPYVLASLDAHTSAVNAVKFSPSGKYLASASDDGSCIVWELRSVELMRGPEEDEYRLETWTCVHRLTSTQRDLFDLAWSADSTMLFTVSVDNSTVVHDLSTRKLLAHLKDHRHYVQGVACDPRNEYFVTMSCDRTACVYTLHDLGIKTKPRHTLKHLDGAVGTLGPSAAAGRAASGDGSGASAPAAGAEPDRTAAAAAGATAAPTALAAATAATTIVAAAAAAPPASVAPAGPAIGTEASGAAADAATEPAKPPRMFRDETVPSFFRRPAWSPDGSLLVLPTGQYPQAGTAEYRNTTFVVARTALNKPALHLPGISSPSVCVRFNPVPYALRPDAGQPWLAAPYRYVFAVATLDEVVLYDTQQPVPLAVLRNLHLRPLTDLAWTLDGSTLLVSSTDGYVSFVRFQAGELGEPLQKDSHLPPGYVLLPDPLPPPPPIQRRAGDKRAAPPPAAPAPNTALPAAAAAAAATVVPAVADSDTVPAQRRRGPIIDLSDSPPASPGRAPAPAPAAAAPGAPAVHVLQPRRKPAAAGAEAGAVTDEAPAVPSPKRAAVGTESPVKRPPSPLREPEVSLME